MSFVDLEFLAYLAFDNLNITVQSNSHAKREPTSHILNKYIVKLRTKKENQDIIDIQIRKRT